MQPTLKKLFVSHGVLIRSHHKMETTSGSQVGSGAPYIAQMGANTDRYGVMLPTDNVTISTQCSVHLHDMKYKLTDLTPGATYICRENPITGSMQLTLKSIPPKDKRRHRKRKRHSSSSSPEKYSKKDKDDKHRFKSKRKKKSVKTALTSQSDGCTLRVYRRSFASMSTSKTGKEHRVDDAFGFDTSGDEQDNPGIRLKITRGADNDRICVQPGKPEVVHMQRERRQTPKGKEYWSSEGRLSEHLQRYEEQLQEEASYLSLEQSSDTNSTLEIDEIISKSVSCNASSNISYSRGNKHRTNNNEQLKGTSSPHIQATNFNNETSGYDLCINHSGKTSQRMFQKHHAVSVNSFSDMSDDGDFAEETSGQRDFRSFTPVTLVANAVPKTTLKSDDSCRSYNRVDNEDHIQTDIVNEQPAVPNTDGKIIPIQIPVSKHTSTFDSNDRDKPVYPPNNPIYSPNEVTKSIQSEIVHRSMTSSEASNPLQLQPMSMRETSESNTGNRDLPVLHNCEPTRLTEERLDPSVKETESHADDECEPLSVPPTLRISESQWVAEDLLESSMKESTNNKNSTSAFQTASSKLPKSEPKHVAIHKVLYPQRKDSDGKDAKKLQTASSMQPRYDPEAFVEDEVNSPVEAANNKPSEDAEELRLSSPNEPEPRSKVAEEVFDPLVKESNNSCKDTHKPQREALVIPESRPQCAEVLDPLVRESNDSCKDACQPQTEALMLPVSRPQGAEVSHSLLKDSNNINEGKPALFPEPGPESIAEEVLFSAGTEALHSSLKEANNSNTCKPQKCSSVFPEPGPEFVAEEVLFSTGSDFGANEGSKIDISQDSKIVFQGKQDVNPDNEGNDISSDRMVPGEDKQGNGSCNAVDTFDLCESIIPSGNEDHCYSTTQSREFAKQDTDTEHMLSDGNSSNSMNQGTQEDAKATEQFPDCTYDKLVPDKIIKECNMLNKEPMPIVDDKDEDETERIKDKENAMVSKENVVEEEKKSIAIDAQHKTAVEDDCSVVVEKEVQMDLQGNQIVANQLMEAEMMPKGVDDSLACIDENNILEDGHVAQPDVHQLEVDVSMSVEESEHQIIDKEVLTNEMEERQATINKSDGDEIGETIDEQVDIHEGDEKNQDQSHETKEEEDDDHWSQRTQDQSKEKGQYEDQDCQNEDDQYIQDQNKHRSEHDEDQMVEDEFRDYKTRDDQSKNLLKLDRATVLQDQATYHEIDEAQKIAEVHAHAGDKISDQNEPDEEETIPIEDKDRIDNDQNIQDQSNQYDDLLRNGIQMITNQDTDQMVENIQTTRNQPKNDKIGDGQQIPEVQEEIEDNRNMQDIQHHSSFHEFDDDSRRDQEKYQIEGGQANQVQGNDKETLCDQNITLFAEPKTDIDMSHVQSTVSDVKLDQVLSHSTDENGRGFIDTETGETAKSKDIHGNMSQYDEHDNEVKDKVQAKADIKQQGEDERQQLYKQHEQLTKPFTCPVDTNYCMNASNSDANIVTKQQQYQSKEPLACKTRDDQFKQTTIQETNIPDGDDLYNDIPNPDLDFIVSADEEETKDKALKLSQSYNSSVDNVGNVKTSEENDSDVRDVNYDRVTVKKETITCDETASHDPLTSKPDTFIAPNHDTTTMDVLKDMQEVLRQSIERIGKARMTSLEDQTIPTATLKEERSKNKKKEANGPIDDTVRLADLYRNMEMETDALDERVRTTMKLTSKTSENAITDNETMVEKCEAHSTTTTIDGDTVQCIESLNTDDSNGIEAVDLIGPNDKQSLDEDDKSRAPAKIEERLSNRSTRMSPKATTVVGNVLQNVIECAVNVAVREPPAMQVPTTKLSGCSVQSSHLTSTDIQTSVTGVVKSISSQNASQTRQNQTLMLNNHSDNYQINGLGFDDDLDETDAPLIIDEEYTMKSNVNQIQQKQAIDKLSSHEDSGNRVVNDGSQLNQDDQLVKKVTQETPQNLDPVHSIPANQLPTRTPPRLSDAVPKAITCLPRTPLRRVAHQHEKIHRNISESVDTSTSHAPSPAELLKERWLQRANQMPMAVSSPPKNPGEDCVKTSPMSAEEKDIITQEELLERDYEEMMAMAKANVRVQLQRGKKEGMKPISAPQSYPQQKLLKPDRRERVPLPASEVRNQQQFTKKDQMEIVQIATAEYPPKQKFKKEHVEIIQLPDGKNVAVLFDVDGKPVLPPSYSESQLQANASALNQQAVTKQNPRNITPAMLQKQMQDWKLKMESKQEKSKVISKPVVSTPSQIQRSVTDPAKYHLDINDTNSRSNTDSEQSSVQLQNELSIYELNQYYLKQIKTDVGKSAVISHLEKLENFASGRTLKNTNQPSKALNDAHAKLLSAKPGYSSMNELNKRHLEGNVPPAQETPVDIHQRQYKFVDYSQKPVPNLPSRRQFESGDKDLQLEILRMQHQKQFDGKVSKRHQNKVASVSQSRQTARQVEQEIALQQLHRLKYSNDISNGQPPSPEKISTLQHRYQAARNTLCNIKPLQVVEVSPRAFLKQEQKQKQQHQEHIQRLTRERLVQFQKTQQQRQLEVLQQQQHHQQQQQFLLQQQQQQQYLLLIPTSNEQPLNQTQQVLMPYRPILPKTHKEQPVQVLQMQPHQQRLDIGHANPDTTKDQPPAPNIKLSPQLEDTGVKNISFDQSLPRIVNVRSMANIKATSISNMNPNRDMTSNSYVQHNLETSRSIVRHPNSQHISSYQPQLYNHVKSPPPPQQQQNMISRQDKTDLNSNRIGNNSSRGKDNWQQISPPIRVANNRPNSIPPVNTSVNVVDAHDAVLIPEHLLLENNEDNQQRAQHRLNVFNVRSNQMVTQNDKRRKRNRSDGDPHISPQRQQQRPQQQQQRPQQQLLQHQHQLPQQRAKQGHDQLLQYQVPLHRVSNPQYINPTETISSQAQVEYGGREYTLEIASKQSKVLQSDSDSDTSNKPSESLKRPASSEFSSEVVKRSKVVLNPVPSKAQCENPLISYKSTSPPSVSPDANDTVSMSRDVARIQQTSVDITNEIDLSGFSVPMDLTCKR
ncbi:uncharacterized protein [Amphiura filiformis]|uniref:uncharacterized protein n=1 Tax=Amphiura filiformis TaxID=82378 RepID=UPI003B21497C